MAEEKKDSLKLKTSIKVLIIGICIFVIGVIATIFYFLNDSLSPFLLVFGFLIIFCGLPLIIIGLIPYLTKVASKLTSETLDYAGESINEANAKTIDVAKTTTNKEIDEIVVPSIGKVVGSVKNSTTDNQSFCPQCGDKIDDDEDFCSNCGLKLKNKCSNCGYINEAENNFCKKCGTKIK